MTPAEIITATGEAGAFLRLHNGRLELGYAHRVDGQLSRQIEAARADLITWLGEHTAEAAAYEDAARAMHRREPRFEVIRERQTDTFTPGSPNTPWGFTIPTTTRR